MGVLRGLLVVLVSLLSLVFGLGLPSASLLAAESYYTWVDENGVTNYAQRSPDGVNAKFIGQEQSFGRAQNTQQAANPEDQQIGLPPKPKPVDPDALVAEERERMQAEVARTKTSNCNIGKRNLAQLQAYSRIRVSDEKGENRILTDEEKQAKMEEARQIIRENCSG